jgi:hypothetical protein
MPTSVLWLTGAHCADKPGHAIGLIPDFGSGRFDMGLAVGVIVKLVARMR